MTLLEKQPFWPIPTSVHMVPKQTYSVFVTEYMYIPNQITTVYEGFCFETIYLQEF